MIWQDFVFLCGSMLSVFFLYPTLRDAAARVPRATSIPSMLIGGAYAFTFFTLGMRFSAFGAFAACTMWSLIALFRAPDNTSLRDDITSQLHRLHAKLPSSTNTTNPDHDTAPTTSGTPHQSSD